MATPTSATPAASAPPFERLLLTGAAGGLGRVLRPRLKRLCRVLRLSDIAPMDPAGAGEEVLVAPLQDGAAVSALVDGVAAIVHLGGVSVEGPFEPILQANIVGAWNLYEGARRHGVKRIVFASSNHVTGFYRQDEVVSPSEPMRPDGHYGLSKAFGENLSRFYFDRYGIETVCLRIGSSFPEPKDRRMLATWLSYDDLERLVVAALTAPVVGHSVVYGMSDNTTTWWDNTSAAHIGYRPRDSSEPFRAALEARQPTLDRSDPATLFQGGGFVVKGPYE
jgi:uronate dehydrogenase